MSYSKALVGMRLAEELKKIMETLGLGGHLGGLSNPIEAI